MGTRKGSAENIREHGTEMPMDDGLLMTRCNAVLVGAIKLGMIV